MDEQQTPAPRPVRPGGSFPPRATPPTVGWTEHPTFDDAPGDVPPPAPWPAPRAPDAVWPGRRSLSTTERVLFCLGALALAGFLGVLVGTADWAGHPALVTTSAGAGAAAVVWLATSAWARRPHRSMLQGSALRGLDRPTRRALARELRAGRPGPPELRLQAVRWTCQTLQAPWGPAMLLALLSSNAGTAADGPTSVWRTVLLVGLVAVNVVVGVQWFRDRPAAQRIADVLDRLSPPSPRTPSSS